MHQHVPMAAHSTPATQLYRQERSAHHQTHTMRPGHVHQSVINMVAFISNGTATMASQGRLRLCETMYARLLNSRPAEMTESESATRSRNVTFGIASGECDRKRVTRCEIFMKAKCVVHADAVTQRSPRR